MKEQTVTFRVFQSFFPLGPLYLSVPYSLFLYLVVKSLDRFDHASHAELTERALAALRGHSSAQFWVSKRVKNAPRQSVGVRGGNEASGGAVTDILGGPADRAAPHRRP